MDSTERRNIQWMQDAILDLDAAWHNYTHATTPLMQAWWLTKVSDAIGDLITYHPLYDPDRGEIPASEA